MAELGAAAALSAEDRVGLVDTLKNKLQSLAELGAAAALSAEDRAGLVDTLKNKLQSLAGQHSDELESPSPSVMKRVEVLREIQVYGGDDSDAESPSQNHSSSATQKLPLDSHKSSSDSNNEQGVLKKGGGN